MKLDKLDTISNQERKIIDFRKLGFNDALVLGKYNYNEARKGLSEHSHKGMMEICYLSKGEQIYFINEKKFHIKGGDVFIAFPNEKHSTGNYPEAKGTLYWLILKIDPKPKCFLNLSEKETNLFINHLYGLNTRLLSGLPNLKIFLDEIFKSYYSNSLLKTIEIKIHLMNFLLEIIKQNQNSSKPILSEKIKKLTYYMEENIEKDLSVEHFASIINLSVSRFKSRFKMELGIPPAEFILRKKIQKAKCLLQNKEKSITEIAFELNFSSSQYFATVFKRFTGKTPSQFKIGE